MSRIVVLGEFERYDWLREDFMFSFPGHFFVGFYFLLELKKGFDLVQILRITYELRRKCRGDKNIIDL